ncbi:hypothetical protein GEV33_004321 [Tenebrio molitor]|uniref:Uncharacterized protein n=1 Tax=Tenebrio molitor TaxID=7067 RepID=A0A8J6HGP8_TENMO|nr:hypothetical protein GEV33_004321 [Tenebrio molitor]
MRKMNLQEIPTKENIVSNKQYNKYMTLLANLQPVFMGQATAAIREQYSAEELSFAAEIKYRASGHLDAAKVLKDIGQGSPSRASDYRNSVTSIRENIITEHNFKASQIYNADEIGLYWRAMPKRTLAHDTEKSAAGFKMNKDRITVLCCANASDAIYEFAHAWNGVKDLNIKRAFSKIMTLEDEIENTDLIIEEELNSSALTTIVSQNENFKNVEENEIEEWINRNGTPSPAPCRKRKLQGDSSEKAMEDAAGAIKEMSTILYDKKQKKREQQQYQCKHHYDVFAEFVASKLKQMNSDVTQDIEEQITTLLYRGIRESKNDCISSIMMRGSNHGRRLQSATFRDCVGCSSSTCNSPVCSLGCTARPQPPQKKTATARV